MNIGERIDELERLREVKADLGGRLEHAKQELAACERAMIRELEDSGQTGTRSETLSVTLAHKLVPKIVDHEEFYTWAVNTGAWEFIRKQTNSGPFEGYIEQNGTPPPGLEADSVARLNYRSLK